jgi:serine/threonine-protein kinase
MTDPSRDARFGETAVSLGFITSQQLEEARSIQKKMVDMGIQEPLQTVMTKRGFLDASRVNQVLKSMGVQIEAIPGYQILGKLGAGGMGAVYKAKQVSMDRVVALKILTAQVSQSVNFIERFLREAQVAAKVNHKNIIQAFDVGSHQGIYYFAMEYVEGETLKDKIKKNGPLSEKKALDVTAQVADALAYINKHGLIHRDIKPENLMMDAQGVVKLCDFGLAKQATGDMSVTRSGFTFGTPYYMSPEQINGEKNLDIRTDLYSLGASLYFMLTGRVMFEGKDLRAVLTRHLTEAPPSPKLVVPTLSDGTCRIMFKMLEKDRDKRYRDPAEIAADCRSILAGAAPAGAAPSKKKLFVAAGAAAGLLLAAGIVIALSMSASKPEAKNPPGAAPPISKTPGGATPKIDENELRAQGVMKRAEEAFLQGEWEMARALYQQLIDESSDTAHVRAKRDDVVKRMDECQKRLNELEAQQRTFKEESERKLRDRFTRAQISMTQKNWAGARDEFHKLALESLPAGLEGKEMRRLAEECDREIRANELWDTLQQLERKGSFEELSRGVTLFDEKYKGTSKYDDVAFELTEMQVRVAKEVRCRQAINDMIFRYDSGRWEEVVDAIAAINTQFQGTRTQSEWKVELESRYGKAREKVLEPLERKAQEKWAETEAAYQAKDYARARGLLDEMSAEPIVSTRKGIEVKPKIAEMRGEIVRLQREAREDRANKVYESMKANMSKLKWHEAQEEIQVLTDELKDTEFVAKKSRELAKTMDKVEAEIQKTTITVIDDFESGIKDWQPVADGEKGRMEESKDSQYGDKAAKVAFVSPKTNYSYLEKKIPRRAPEGTVGISIWVKAVDKPAKFRLQVRQGEAEQQVVWGVERVIGTEWTLVRVGFSEMRHVWSAAAQKKQTIPKFDPSKIRAVEISQIDPRNLFSMIVDHLKWETRR